jgi:hypothetical protein
VINGHGADLERHQDRHVGVAVGMRHRLVQGYAVDDKADVAAVATVAEATQHDRVADAGETVVPHGHARHEAKQLLWMADARFADLVGVEARGRERCVRALQCLAFDDHATEIRGCFGFGNLRLRRRIRRVIIRRDGGSGREAQAERLCRAQPGEPRAARRSRARVNTAASGPDSVAKHARIP